MKLLRAVLREYADTKEYPTKRLLSDLDPDWAAVPREGEVRHGPYDLVADYERQVVVVTRTDGVRDHIPFSLVGFMRPLDAKRPEQKEPAAECEKCGEKFDTPQKLGGHKRHCKGRVQ